MTHNATPSRVASRDTDLSILIASRDRAASLAQTLEALSAQELDGLSWEVVVVDNGSSDQTQSVLAKASQSLPLVPLEEPVPGKNKALNRALDAASGRLLLFTDDDVIPHRRWAIELLQAAQRWPRDNIFGGAVRPRFPASAPRWMTGPPFPYGRWAFGEHSPRPDEGPTSETPLGSNLAIRKHLFDETKFDERMGPKGSDYPMGSEVELLMRLYRRGEQFIHVPVAKVEHVLPPDATQTLHLARRAYRCGRGNAWLFPDVGSFPLFGIPLYTVQRTVKAFAARVVSPLRNESDRCIALLTWQQLKGEISERRRMQVEAGKKAQAFPQPATVWRAFEQRGFAHVALSSLRWILRPVVHFDLHQVLEYVIDPGLRVPQVPECTISVLNGMEQSHEARVALCPMGLLEPEEIDRRLARGDSVAIAYSGKQAVGFAWCAYSDLSLSELRARLHVGATEVVGYDGYVSEDWRGRGVVSAVDAALVLEASRRGRRRQWVFTNTRNKPMLTSMLRAGKQKFVKVAVVRLPWARREYRWVLGSKARRRCVGLSFE